MESFLKFSMINEPAFLVNFHMHVEKSDWRAVGVRWLIPACAPEAVANAGIWSPLELVDAIRECVIKHAVREGCFRMDHLRTLLASLKLDVKAPKGGNVKKIDLARALVEHWFPDASEKDKTFMIQKIHTVGNFRIQGDAKKILQMVSEMDIENALEFDKVKKLAKSKLDQQTRQQVAKEALDEQARKMRAGAGEADPHGVKRKRASDAGVRGPNTGPRKAPKTPASIKSLIHERLQAVGVQVTREPKSYGYRAIYNDPSDSVC